MKKWEKKAIKEIMNNFDFEKVHKVMVFLKWSWAGYGVPDIKTIKKAAKEVLMDLIKDSNEHDICELQTGGFTARIEKSNKYMSLSFVIADWNNV